MTIYPEGGEGSGLGEGSGFGGGGLAAGDGSGVGELGGGAAGWLLIVVLASFTASAFQENFMSTGAGLLSLIVNPFVFLLVTI